MTKLKKISYSLRDIMIIPAEETYIDHRTDIYPFITICGRTSYPIFVAPSRSITDEDNYGMWIDKKVNPVIPMSVSERLSIEERIRLSYETFVSFSITEAEMLSYSEETPKYRMHICIDLPNGHLHRLLMLCKSLKTKYDGNIEIMTGNVGNPEVYRRLCTHGISWIRTSIGQRNDGVGYGSATLLDELCEEKRKYLSKHEEFDASDNYTKIVADGCIDWYDDICKAIAIGADAVMVGKMFAECDEASGKVLYCKSESDFINNIGFFEDELYGISEDLSDNLTPYRGYEDGNGTEPVIVKYPAEHFVSNVDAYLRSAMSYCNAYTLKDFSDEARLVIIGGSGN